MSGDLGFTVAEHAEFLRIQARDCEREMQDPRLSAAKRDELRKLATDLHDRADRMMECH